MNCYILINFNTIITKIIFIIYSYLYIVVFYSLNKNDNIFHGLYILWCKKTFKLYRCLNKHNLR